MNRDEKLYFIKVGNVYLGVIMDEKPTRIDIEQYLAKAMEMELYHLDNDPSGWRSYENIKKDRNGIRDTYGEANELLTKEEFMIKVIERS